MAVLPEPVVVAKEPSPDMGKSRTHTESIALALRHRLFCVIFILATPLLGQSKLDKALERFNKESVPYISVEDLVLNTSKFLLLDTRKREEFEVSHIPGAVWVGEALDKAAFAKAHTDTSKPIVVYCSIGVRSEKIGESLQEMGYVNVYNLYGSIFEWKNKGNPVVNLKNQPTDSVHVYNKHWGSYLTKGIKVHR